MLVVFIFFCLLFSTGTQSYRLSRDVLPKHYSLKIRPDFEKQVFFGEVLIYINTITDNEKIILHSSQLNITETYINQKGAILKVESDERISVKYAFGSLQPGEHTLHFKYEGPLREGKYGFIKAPFKYNGEEETYIYVTDLEPTNARKVFPCFDEPFFKAKFNVKLVSPVKGYVAISNMPEINHFDTPEGTVYNFGTSVVMSTYLVSFAFTHYPKYEEVMEQNGNKVPIAIYTLNASEFNNKEPMKFAKKALQYYTEYTGIPYPLPKLDMIEYERTESAATENWGLITFRKGLLTPRLNIYYKSQIELVVYHELSHFWFGNLVTNDWWNDLWLQEGFASYMSYKLSAKENGLSEVKNMKEFQIGRYLETELQIPAFSIVSYITQPTFILKKFSNIVYDKAANLLLILESIIGEDKFKETIRKYLKKFAYKTVTTNDFLTTLEEVVPNIDVRSFMESYLYQKAYPLITVDEESNGTYILRQYIAQRVYDVAKPLSRGQWTIPVTYKTDISTTSEILWFDKDMDVLEIKVPNAKWFLLNNNGLEMYKTKLSDDLWDHVIEYFDDMDVETTEQIASDAYYLFQFNMSNCDRIIKLIEAVKTKEKWGCFAQFYLNLNYSFLCHNYNDELKIFLDFMNKRFAETNFTRKPSLDTSCTKSDNDAELLNLHVLDRCAIWIKDNLGGTEDKTVKIV